MPIIDNNEIDKTTEAYKVARHFYEGIVNYNYIPNGMLAHMIEPEIGKAALNLVMMRKRDVA